MPRLKALANRPEPEFPVLSRLLWQALALGSLVSLALLALPLAPGGAAARPRADDDFDVAGGFPGLCPGTVACEYCKLENKYESFHSALSDGIV